MRFKRKRQTGVWLPPDPYNGVLNGPTIPFASTDEAAFKIGQLDAVDSFGITSTVDFPLVGDFNQDRVVGETLATGPTLSDSRFGYSLKRVVGDIFISAQQFDPQDLTIPGAWFVTAGVIVRRTDDVGDPLTIQTSVQSYDAAGDPWLWRRNWILTNQPQEIALTDSAWINFPPTNVGSYAGSIQTGHRCDQKTRRTIKQEERLYLHVSATPINGAVGGQTTSPLRIAWDLRFFGRIFTSAGNRRNAAR